jgi:hypothetical protein
MLSLFLHIYIYIFFLFDAIENNSLTENIFGSTKKVYLVRKIIYIFKFRKSFFKIDPSHRPATTKPPRTITKSFSGYRWTTIEQPLDYH